MSESPAEVNESFVLQKTRLAICGSQVEKGSWFSVDFNKTTLHF